MVARDAELAGYEDGRVHFQHLSCAASVHAVAAAKERGFRVSAEVTPHHLLLTDEHVRSMDTRMKMNPPLASEADRVALIEGLRSGVIDCVATDHAPHARHEKEVPFEQAPMGTTGLETAFAALHTELVLPGTIGLALLVERMTAGADLFGLPTPRIAVGEPANLTLCDLSAEWVAGEQGWESRSENCCFAGRRLTGRVLMTVAAGAVAYRKPAFSVVGADMTLLESRASATALDRRRRAGGLSLLRKLRRSGTGVLEARARRSDPRRAAHRQRAVSEGPRSHRTRGRPGGRAAHREDRLLGRARRRFRSVWAHTGDRVRDRDTCVRIPDRPRPARSWDRSAHTGRRRRLASRLDYERGLERLERAGATVSTVESSCSSCWSEQARPSSRKSRGSSSDGRRDVRHMFCSRTAPALTARHAPPTPTR